MMLVGTLRLWVSMLRRKLEASEQMEGSGRGGRGEIGQLERLRLWLLQMKLLYWP